MSRRKTFWHIGAAVRSAKIATRADGDDRVIYRVANGRMLSICLQSEWTALSERGAEYQESVLALREPVPSL